MVNNTLDHDHSDNVRTMVARWVITGNLVLKTAAHFGGEGESSVDLKLLRDSVDDNSPLLPGTSLAGALRSHLADVLGGFLSDEPKEVEFLFGLSRGRNDDDGSQSPLIIFDTRGMLPAGLQIEIRDGVSINSATGTAEPHMKFDVEILPAGTNFPIRVDLIVDKSKHEPKLISYLAKSLEGLCNGGISLGMRRSRGLGSVKAQDWKAVRYDLTTLTGWLQWMTSQYEDPMGHVPMAYDSPVEAMRMASPDLSFNELTIDKRKQIIVEAYLQIDEDLLIRSPGRNAKDPDVIHLHSANKPVLPGTSLAGVMRGQALRIARCVRQHDGAAWVDRLFGPHIDRTNQRASRDVQPNASRLRISESFLSNQDARKQTRIAIDRFTGGASSGALFDEQVHTGGSVMVKIELRNPTDPEIGFLLLLLKDLLTGEIPVGGTTSVGRGMLKGTATVHLPSDHRYDICSDLEVTDDGAERFTSFIKAFRNEPSIVEENEL